MRDIYPDYAEDVAFFAVGAHYGIIENIDTLEANREKNNYPWPVAAASPQILVDLGITLQSTKIAFDSTGTIVYRDEMGQGDDEEWRRVFAGLAGGGGGG